MTKSKKELERQRLQAKLSDVEYVKENAPLLNWAKLVKEYEITNEVIQVAYRYIHWGAMFRYKKLDDDIIIQFRKKAPINHILYYQNISEYLIENLLDRMDNKSWTYVSKKAILSLPFIEKHFAKLDLNALQTNHLTISERRKIESLKLMDKLTNPNSMYLVV